jgi:hypothetical protein
LNWNTNKVPRVITIDSIGIEPNKKSHTFTDLELTNSKTYTLKVIDEKDASATKTTTITFCNNIYYGVGTVESGFTESLVKGLTKVLQPSKAYDFTVNPSAQYIYYAVPKRLGTVTFKVGGFEGGFEATETVSVKNDSGYTEDYYVYRSTNPLSTSISVDVT